MSPCDIKAHRGYLCRSDAPRCSFRSKAKVNCFLHALPKTYLTIAFGDPGHDAKYLEGVVKDVAKLLPQLFLGASVTGLASGSDGSGDEGELAALAELVVCEAGFALVTVAYDVTTFVLDARQEIRAGLFFAVLGIGAEQHISAFAGDAFNSGHQFYFHID